MRSPRTALALLSWLLLAATGLAQGTKPPVRVFLFAGQSNMVGADTDPALAETYPPYAGITKPRTDVRYAFSVGRWASDGFTALAPCTSWSYCRTTRSLLQMFRRPNSDTSAPVRMVTPWRRCSAV